MLGCRAPRAARCSNTGDPDVDDASQRPDFTRLTDLAAERFGGRVLWCTDDFFAEKENLIRPGDAIFIPGKYTDRGKWMDGWESRRKRTEGHDIAVLELGAPGRVHGFDVDTSHFLGNHPPFCAIEACHAPAGLASPDGAGEAWTGILPRTPLSPGSHHFLAAASPAGPEGIATHVRLHIFPDGGVARLRVYGDVWRDWSRQAPGEAVDLAAARNGARALVCNDMFFSHMQNLLMPGRGVDMGDGWETRRNRTPGNRDWVVVRLAHRGVLQRVVVDTAHFKGNYPDRFRLDGCDADHDDPTRMEWRVLLGPEKLEADREHEFTLPSGQSPVTHVQLSIFPDGGVSRLRAFGTLAAG